MNPPARMQELINKGLQDLHFENHPASLYDPIRYMLTLGGKRMRPILVLMSTELFGGKIENALPAALGIELFHNFTLLHDDIMDKAPLRRSKPTVHEKWNSDIAILSGDAMFVKSSQLIAQVPDAVLRKVLDIFYKSALEICEGQQLDMDYEKNTEVTVDDYLDMIRLKTAVLLGCCLEIGALIAGANEAAANNMYDCGVNLGMAFQLQDDILDVYGDAEKFGKQVGGDILSNKKTFLLLTALNSCDENQLKELHLQLKINTETSEQRITKVENVKKIFEELKVRERAEEKMNQLFDIAFKHLDAIPVAEDKKIPLKELASELMVRQR